MSTNQTPSFLEIMKAIEPVNLGIVGSFKLPTKILEGKILGVDFFSSVEIEVPIEALVYRYPGGGHELQLQPAGVWTEFFECAEEDEFMDEVEEDLGKAILVGEPLSAEELAEHLKDLSPALMSVATDPAVEVRKVTQEELEQIRLGYFKVALSGTPAVGPLFEGLSEEEDNDEERPETI